MFVSRWSIRRKLLVCLAIVLAIVGALAYSGFSGGYSYRELAWTIRVRAMDLKLAGELTEDLSDLRVSLSQTRELELFETSAMDQLAIRDRFFYDKLLRVEQDLEACRRNLEQNALSDARFGDRTEERRTIDELEAEVVRLRKSKTDQAWVFASAQIAMAAHAVEEMYAKASGLQNKMHDRMRNFVSEARSEYRTWIITEWTATIVAAIFLPVAIFLFYDWLFQPLGILLAGSRRIARQDDFDHRIHLKNHDEMAELGAALNDMTARFQEIRSDLDAQVKQRTKEVVRGEQMASVGFLAAGVAHEINNPLASIAWCAESLDSRLSEALQENAQSPQLAAGDLEILQKYLRRIQDEAFRCKGITEKLLDFSRLGDMEKHDTDLGELVTGVIEMVRHLGKYKQKKIEFDCREYVTVPVNAQEIKQVVLNLITNALDSLDANGTVWISLVKSGPWAELVVRDNGCGMTDEVLKHLFEPFFTRRRDGSGTGLGLSITYRIVTDHGGAIEPQSAGRGRGATMRVRLPLQPLQVKSSKFKVQSSDALPVLRAA
ncbi:MAG TPA: HAMP domain-containing sensor histidine kinase [Pirellulaceae bacterium]